MSAPRSKGFCFAFLMRKPYQLVHSAFTLFWGLLQGVSKRTAGKDRLFFIAPLLYKTSHHHKYALLYPEDKLVSLLDC